MIHNAKFYPYLFENQIDNLKVPQDILYLLIDLVRLRSFSLSKLLLVTNISKHYHIYEFNYYIKVYGSQNTT